jgi:hypothetical protein
MNQVFAQPRSEADKHPPITSWNRFAFRKQWALRSKEDPSIDGWIRFDLNKGRRLFVHPDARVQPFTTLDKRAGFIIGVCIDTANRKENGAGESLSRTDSHLASLQPILKRLAGIYVILLDGPQGIVLFTDPAKLAGVFYHRGRAASTPALFPGVEKDPLLAKIYPLNNPVRWYPGRLTPWKEVFTPLANHAHYLDSGREERFWPLDPMTAGDGRVGIDRLLHALGNVFEGYMNAGPLLMSITGGKDSRLNLAFARPWVDRLKFFTVISDEIADCDKAIPERLSMQFSLDHRFYAFNGERPLMLNCYDQIGAQMATGPRRNVIPALAPLAEPDFIHLNGILGAVFKTYYWPGPSHRLNRWNAKLLYREFPYVMPAVLKDEIRHWETSVEHLPLALRYNLMYCEMRAAKWMSPGETASKVIYDSVTLQASREVLALFSALPTQLQYNQRAFQILIERMWPEILKIPYCYNPRKWSKYLPNICIEVARRALKR